MFFIRNRVKINIMKIKEMLEYGRDNLINKEDAIRLSKLLLCYLLKVDSQYLLINNDKEIRKEIVEEFENKIEILNQNIPIQYIIHKQEFMNMIFYVDKNVLIPQPDTEVLVEEIIDMVTKEELIIESQKSKNVYQILDLCAGSGAIGISLAKNLSNVKVTMADISQNALEIAKKNAHNNKVINCCEFILSDMFEGIKTKFDIIVSNPPYIKTNIINTLSMEVQNEPHLALDGGQDGLDFYRIIAKKAYQYLNNNGILALEIGYDQKEDVIKLLEKEEKYTQIYSKKDLAGNDRIIVCKKL